MFIARQFYKTTAVVKMLGKQDGGLPGVDLLPPQLSCLANTPMHACASLPAVGISAEPFQSQHGRAGVTLNRSLYETVLRELLLERAEHTVELYEGSGAAWRKTR